MPILDRLGHLDEARAWEGSIPFQSLYTAGVAGQRWLRALKAEGVIYGTRCEACGVTYVPGRLYCERCFAHLGDDAWIKVGPLGTVESYTVLHLAADGRPVETPRILALIRLDGAETVLVHELGDLGPRPPAIGLRVRPVFKPAEQRTASITDIQYFGPA